jgi:hypothetical protein
MSSYVFYKKILQNLITQQKLIPWKHNEYFREISVKLLPTKTIQYGHCGNTSMDKQKIENIIIVKPPQSTLFYKQK